MKLPGPGDVFEGYRIVDVIGSGGFAQVYAATDQMGHAVALKVLKPGPDGGYNSRLEQRFMREAEAVASLTSPHTLKIYSYGRALNGLLYMSFERLAGQDLDAMLITRGRLTEPEAVHVTRQILLSLSEAHGRGLLHRDIKPSNVRILEHAQDPLFVKVMDFGIAKSIVEPDTPLTRTGDIVGTPRYMAPEQLMDDPLTPAVDVFAVGLVAHDMLFGLESRARPSLMGLEIPPGASISDHLRDVLNHALVPDPDARLGGAAQMLRALETPAAARSTSSQSVSHSASGSLSQPEPRRIWPAIVASTCLIAAVAAIGISARTADEPSPTPVPVKRGNPLALVQPPADEISPTPVTSEDAGGQIVGPCGQPSPFWGLGTVTTTRGLDRVSWPVYVPQSYDGSSPTPVIILMHDQMATMGEFIEYPPLQKLAEDEGYILFAPEDGPVEPWMDLPSDIDKVLTGLAAVSESFCTDPDRRYAIGHGRGSVVVETMACSEQFSAVATTNHTRSKGHQGSCARPTRTIHLHGMDDPFHPGAGGESCTSKIRESVDERDAVRRGQRQCERSRPKTVHTEKTGECLSWSCDPPFVSCRFSGGHNWPGTGDRMIDIGHCENDPAQFDYVDVIAKFFRGELK